MAYISLLALSLTVTNLVPLNAVGFFLLLLCSRRFFGRSYPAIIKPISSIRLFVMAATEHRPVSPSNVLILSLVVSLWVAARSVSAGVFERQFCAPDGRTPS